DFGLIEGDSQHPDLEISPWVDDELVIFAAPDHPLARCKQISLEDVTKEAWILREAGSGTRQVSNAAFRHVLHKLDIRLELEHTEAIKRAGGGDGHQLHLAARLNGCLPARQSGAAGDSGTGSETPVQLRVASAEVSHRRYRSLFEFMSR